MQVSSMNLKRGFTIALPDIDMNISEEMNYAMLIIILPFATLLSECYLSD